MAEPYIVMPGARLYMDDGHLVESTGAYTGPSAGPIGRKHVHEYSCQCPPALDGPIADAVSAPEVRMLGAAVATYHGYKRTKSVGWTLVWSAFGGLSPVFTTVLAVAQGFGKPNKKK